MKFPVNKFKKAILANEKQIGLWVSMCSNYAAEVVGGSAFDWVVIDSEHSPNSLPTIMSQIQAFSGSEVNVMARPTWNNPVEIKRLLDAGVSGLVIPMVNTAEEAELAVKSTKYPPHGIRGVAGLVRASNYGRYTDYFERVNDEIAVIVQIETKEAIENVKDIASVPGVDAVFFGPADIHASYGHLGPPNRDDVWNEIILPAATKVQNLGKPTGTLVVDPAFASNLLTNKGFTFLACGVDTGILKKGCDDVLGAIRKNIT
jgi:4-hydroxy-2-oxoheptanedioate aldolase